MKTLAVLDPRAAFVDVGSEHMHVSVAGDEPAVFGTVTSQLHALRDWLKSQGVRSVAMQATGVYWLALYGVLEVAGFEVRMVNGRQTRNVPGRKTDMQDAQWGATLHMHGLLKAGFVPPADIRRLQDYLRLRADHVCSASSHVQHMQKSLERMNIKLHHEIASLAGMSGMAIVRAIIEGERSPDGSAGAVRPADPSRQGRAGQGGLAWNLGERAHLRVAPGAAKLGALPAADRRVRPADPGHPASTRPRSACTASTQDAQAGGSQLARHSQAARDPGSDVRRARPHPTSRTHALWRAADHRRGRHRSYEVAHREALHRVDRSGPGKPPQWQAQKPRAQAQAQSHGSAVLHDGAVTRAQQRHRPRRLLSAHGGQARGLIATMALARKLAAWYWCVMVKGDDYVEKGLANYDAQVLQTKQRALKRLAKELGQQLVPIADSA